MWDVGCSEVDITGLDVEEEDEQEAAKPGKIKRQKAKPAEPPVKPFPIGARRGGGFGVARARLPRRHRGVHTRRTPRARARERVAPERQSCRP